MEAKKTALPRRGTSEWTALIDQLAHALNAGGLVLLPAEGLYGLHGAGPKGQARLREVKGDRAGRPFIILIPSAADVHRYARGVPPGYADLVESAWPGPLTLVLPARGGLPPDYTWEETVALRCPGEEILRELAATLAEPLLSTSANRSGEAAPRTYDDIEPALRARCVIGVDGGPRRGTGSTLARLEADGTLTILRPGLWRPDHSS